MPNSNRVNSRSLFERLEARGIGKNEYVDIKIIVSFDLPQSLLFFKRQFPDWTPFQVLQQVEKWRNVLKRDFILSDPVKDEVEKTVLGAEWLAWRAIAESAFSRPQGSWRLSRRFLSTSKAGGVAYIKPDTEITATHSETKEKRVVVMPYRRGDSAWGVGWKTAFLELGVLDQVLNHHGQRPLATHRAEQGWPIFTQFVIPRLYEFLHPYYHCKGHATEKELTLKRNAIFPNELLQDMVDILKHEHPNAFESTTLRQTKAAVQRYLEKKGKVLTARNSPKKQR